MEETSQNTVKNNIIKPPPKYKQDIMIKYVIIVILLIN